jgi:hypothetical protein
MGTTETTRVLLVQHGVPRAVQAIIHKSGIKFQRYIHESNERDNVFPAL